MKNRSIIVDGRTVECAPDDTLLVAARRADVHVPTLCHDPRLAPRGTCGICAVEVRRGTSWRQVPACSTRVDQIEAIRTRSDALTESRRWTLGLLFSTHSPSARYHPDRVGTAKKPLVCACQGHRSCTLRALCLELRADPDRLPRSVDPTPPVLLRVGIELEMSKCILCDRCVRICREVAGVEALSLAGRGQYSTVSYAAPTSAEGRSRCDRCEARGALCIDTCPTDALHRPRPARLKVVP